MIPTATTCISPSPHTGLHAPPDTAADAARRRQAGPHWGLRQVNALQARRFGSLVAQNAFLRQWNRTIARLRIHRTTRRQVWTHFVEVEHPALQPLVVESFPCFSSADRTV